MNRMKAGSSFLGRSVKEALIKSHVCAGGHFEAGRGARGAAYKCTQTPEQRRSCFEMAAASDTVPSRSEVGAGAGRSGASRTRCCADTVSAPALRVAAQIAPCGVNRRLFGMTKLHASFLAWRDLGRATQARDLMSDSLTVMMLEVARTRRLSAAVRPRSSVGRSSWPRA